MYAEEEEDEEDEKDEDEDEEVGGGGVLLHESDNEWSGCARHVDIMIPPASLLPYLSQNHHASSGQELIPATWHYHMSKLSIYEQPLHAQ